MGVAEKGCFFEPLQENRDGNFRVWQEDIEHMSAKHKRLVATMDSKQKLMNGLEGADLGEGK